jgi:hypothetical protein
VIEVLGKAHKRGVALPDCRRFPATVYTSTKWVSFCGEIGVKTTRDQNRSVSTEPWQVTDECKSGGRIRLALRLLECSPQIKRSQTILLGGAV